MENCSLEIFRPLIRLLPEVRKPARMPALQEKLLWTLAGLILFFVMYHIYPIGVDVAALANSRTEFMQIVFASKTGSLLTAGIGPIVLASIFLQLFVGAKLINVNMRDPKHKELFSGTQKLLAIFLSFAEAWLYTANAIPIAGAGTGESILATQILVALQLAMGSIILLYMDELLSKYGIGSGISLFIAAGVSLAVVQTTFGINGIGLLPDAIKRISEGGTDAIPKALIVFIPLAFTGIVFAASVYAEGMKVEIPLAFERARGFGGRFPIKFLYVSNLPVILASALIANFSWFFRSSWPGIAQGINLQLGGQNIMNFFATVSGTGNDAALSGGLVYLITPSFNNPILVGGYDVYINLLLTSSSVLAVPFVGLLVIPEVLHMATYVLFYVTLCIVFGRFWIETTGMDSRSVSEQLQSSGLNVPGYRRDPRITERVLDKYIPTITILGSAFVGLLAAFADLTGAVGTGTGILLTVGIYYRMYEQLATERMFEVYPDLKKFMG